MNAVDFSAPPQRQRGSVMFLPNSEAFLTDYHFFRIPPEGAFGVAASVIEEEVSRGVAAWTNAHWDGRLAVRGDHLRSIVDRHRAASTAAATQSAPPSGRVGRRGGVATFNPNLSADTCLGDDGDWREKHKARIDARLREWDELDGPTSRSSDDDLDDLPVDLPPLPPLPSDDDVDEAAFLPTVPSAGSRAAVHSKPQGIGPMASATERWNELVEANKAKGMAADKAVRVAVHQHPDLHKAYLAEYNADAQHRQAAAETARHQRVARNF